MHGASTRFLFIIDSAGYKQSPVHHQYSDKRQTDGRREESTLTLNTSLSLVAFSCGGVN